jgi:F-type H+-transporting ATPase subunit gamma
MANLKILRERIQSINATKKITSAMKLIATSRFKKIQKHGREALSYSEKINHLLVQALHYEPLEAQLPLLIRGNKGKRHLMLILGSDKGLCGGFNINSVKHAIHQTHKMDQEVKFLCIGQKVFSSLPSSLRSEVLETIPMDDKTDYAQILKLAHRLKNLLEEGMFDACSIVHNQFKSIICYIPTFHSLVPLGPSLTHKTLKEVEDKGPLLFAVEPKINTLLKSLAFQNLTAQLYYACVDSHMSEHSARMMAMDSSTRNAEDMLYGLKTNYHRSRQAMITNELIEIIAGAESL